MAVAWLVKFIDQREWQQFKAWVSPKRETAIWRVPFVLPVFLLVVSYLVSTLFSVTPSVSLAGSYQRLQGTYTTLSYIVIFALLAATMRRREQASRLVTFIIITSIPVAFYGLLQHFSLDPLPWGGDVSIRVAGHMGNAIFVGAYLILAVPLTLARIIAAFNNILNDEELSSADVLRASIYIFALAIQLITIYWSGSRGPWLGLFVGLFAFVLIVLVAVRNAADSTRRFSAVDALKAVGLVVGGAIVTYFVVAFLMRAITSGGRLPSLAGPMGSFGAFVVALAIPVLIIFVMAAARRGWRWLWLSWIVLALVVGGWLVAFNLPAEVTEPYEAVPVVGGVVATLDEWRGLPTIGRFGELLEAEDGTGRVRTLIWTGALKLVLPHEPLDFPGGATDTWNVLRPLIGYGPESMYVAYNRFYPPELATLEARNASPDRSHNETFDALVITGLFGFVYLAVFVYQCVLLWFPLVGCAAFKKGAQLVHWPVVGYGCFGRYFVFGMAWVRVSGGGLSVGQYFRYCAVSHLLCVVFSGSRGGDGSFFGQSSVDGGFVGGGAGALCGSSFWDCDCRDAPLFLCVCGVDVGGGVCAAEGAGNGRFSPPSPVKNDVIPNRLGKKQVFGDQLSCPP